MMRWSTAELFVSVAAASAIVLLASCGEVPDDDLVAGTGSSGGNPATVAFQMLSGEPDVVAWERGRLAAAMVEFSRLDVDGVCVPSPDETWEFGAFIEIGSAQLAAIDVAGLCRVHFVPSPSEPLVFFQGETPRAPLRVELILANGVDMVFDREIPLGTDDPIELVVAVDPTALLERIDLAQAVTNEDGELVLTDAEGSTLSEALLTNLIESLSIYVDPTPGDLRVSLDERTDANRVGGIDLPNDE